MFETCKKPNCWCQGKFLDLMEAYLEGKPVTQNKFWMVIKAVGSGANANSTSMRHSSKDIAEREAERLSKQTGDEFILLESIASVKPKYSPLVWKDIPDA